ASFTDLTVGQNGGTGSVNISGGGSLESSGTALLGNGTNSAGRIDVQGAGSQWRCSGPLILGSDVGLGSMTISGGGSASCTGASTKLGIFHGLLRGAGRVDVIGSGSRWINSGELEVGSGGSGIVNISGGGLLQSTTTSVGGTSDSSSSVVTVRDVGSG